MVDAQLSTTRRWLLDSKKIVDSVDMAGYDFIIEISRAMVERMVVRNVVTMFTPKGVEPVLPFELIYNFPFSGFDINFHAIVEDIKIDLVEDDFVQATIMLEKMSVDNKGEIMLSKLSGNLVVKIPIVLDDVPGDDVVLQIDLPKASVAFSFSDVSRRQVVDYISMFPDYSIDDVESGFETPVLDALKREGPFKLFVFKVNPENDGSLEPLRFSSLEVHTVTNAKREKQSIALLGSFSPERQGDFSKLPSSTVQVQNASDFSFRVSRDAFIDMVLNKGLEEFFPSYATSGEISFDTGTDLETMYITGIKCDFRENRTGGLIYFSGKCYANANIACVESVEATFGLHFRLLTENGAIKFESCNVDIEPDVSLSWYCLVIGLLGLVAAIVLDILEEEMFKPDATNNLRAMIQKFCETMSIKKNFGKFAIEFKDIHVLSDQVFAGGTIGGADELPARVQPSLDLEVTEQHAWSKISNQTKWVDNEHWCKYVRGKEYKEADVFVYHEFMAVVHPSLLCRPVTYKWQVRSEGMTYTIPPDGGKIKILALTRQSKGEMRIPDVVQAPVTLDCKFNKQTLYIKNDPEDGDYSFFLEVIATDDDGVKVDNFEFINVIGRYKTGTLEYTNDVMKCRMERANAEKGRLLEISELGYIEKTLGKSALQGKGSTLVNDRLTHVLNHERAGGLQRALDRSLLHTGDVSSSHLIGQARMIVDIANRLLMARKLDQDLPSNNMNKP